MAEPFLETWSADYWMVANAEVRTWSDDEAHMDAGLYERIAREIGGPVVGFIDGAHYHFKPSRQVLSNECVIPGTGRGSKPSSLLVCK